MSKRYVNPAGMADPSARYSHAVIKRGTPVFVAGQVAVDGDGKVVGAGDVAAQIDQAFRNVQTVVEACGGTIDDVVAIRVYAVQSAWGDAFREALAATRRRVFQGGPYPASTLLVISALAQPDFLCEVEAVAMLDDA